MDVAAHRKRLQIMLAVVGASLALALVMIFLSIRTHSPLATVGFAAALVAGFGAQFWMIWSWKRDEARQAGGKA